MDILLILSRTIIIVLLGFCAIGDIRTRTIKPIFLLALIGVWIVSVVASRASLQPETWIYIGARLGVVIVFMGACMLCASLYEVVTHRYSFGGGDIKLFGVCVMLLGLERGLLSIVVACAIGVIYAQVLYAGEKTFPFGPAIVASTYVFLATSWM